jgi:hypothetical protein
MRLVKTFKGIAALQAMAALRASTAMLDIAILAIAVLTMATLAMAIRTPVRAQDLGEAVKRGFYDDAELTLHVRSYYLDRTNPVPANEVAWAGGGWIGYQTGWILDVFRFGAVGYTSQPIWAPPGNGGTLLLQPGQLGYTVLGQAYGKLRFWDQEFTAYRQLINQPEVNPHDNRMTPNTFEAYAFTGTLGPVAYLAGYVDKMKPRDATEFFDMATVAGAPAGVSSGMWLGGLDYALDENLKARLSSYHVPNVLTSGYADVAWFKPLTEDIDVRLGGQLMVQGSNGTNALTGQPFSTWSGGLDLDVIWGAATLTTSYTQTGSTALYRTPYGTWAGYTSMIIRNFNRANEGAFLIGATLDLAVVKAPGFAFNTNVVFGNGAINPATGAALSTNNEYDFTLDYVFANSALNWPDWLKPLWLRGRAALLDQYQNGSLATVRDYRVILNYEWKFGGKAR